MSTFQSPFHHPAPAVGLITLVYSGKIYKGCFSGHRGTDVWRSGFVLCATDPKFTISRPGLGKNMYPSV